MTIADWTVSDWLSAIAAVGAVVNGLLFFRQAFSNEALHNEHYKRFSELESDVAVLRERQRDQHQIQQQLSEQGRQLAAVAEGTKQLQVTMRTLQNYLMDRKP